MLKNPKISFEPEKSHFKSEISWNHSDDNTPREFFSFLQLFFKPPSTFLRLFGKIEVSQLPDRKISTIYKAPNKICFLKYMFKEID